MTSITSLPIERKFEFWANIKARVNNNKISVFSDNGLIYVAMEDTYRMRPIVRRKNELFSKTVQNSSKENKVIINGQFYALSKKGVADALFGDDPVDPEETTPEGLVIENGKILSGRPAPDMFYLANYIIQDSRYVFGFGAAPKNANAAIGGCGPIIINGLPYGPINTYIPGISGVSHGEPSEENRKHLKQRSNNTFSSFLKRPPYTGQTIVAHSSIWRMLFVLVLPHGIIGPSLTNVRDKLLGVGFDNAVFLDGSDSSMLMVEGDFLCRSGQNKDETNNIGIGFF